MTRQPLPLPFLLPLFLSVLVSQASEEWYFLPNYRHDVRGIEQSDTGDGGDRFHDILPEAARPLLRAGALEAAQMEEFFWHPVSFPHREFTELMPERQVFGWYACEFIMHGCFPTALPQEAQARFPSDGRRTDRGSEEPRCRLSCRRA